MKKLSLFAALITLTLASCSTLDFNMIEDIVSAAKTEVAATELPDNALTVLNSDYFGTYIDKVLEADGLGFEVSLSDGFKVYFDKDGDQLNGEATKKGRKGKKHGGDKCHSIDSTDLPETITTYISTNYPGVTIERAKLNHDGGYMVKVTGDLILIFDANGTFLEEGQFMNHKGHHGTSVAIENLPTTITGYITENYGDYAIEVAFLKGDKYLVGVTNGTDKKMLIFDTEGNFIEEKVCNG